MEITFEKTQINSSVRAISSKSEAHRALICAAIADSQTEIVCADTNADIDATVGCLNSLGADIVKTKNGFAVTPIKDVRLGASLDCNESGSTLRFLLPLASALGANCEFIMRGRLSQRPLSPLYKLLEDNSISLSPQGSSPLCIKGKLSGNRYAIEANVSSQYVSGLLMALSVSGKTCILKLTGEIQSSPYIDITVSILEKFGAQILFDSQKQEFTIIGKERLSSPKAFEVAGDWSNAAFFLCAGAIGPNPVTLENLELNSKQGDKAILDILVKMGAKIACEQGKITVFPSKLTPIDIDASQIPDLVPILATTLSLSSSSARIYNGERLKLKESDRIKSVCNMLSSLGADITPTNDGMIINGIEQLGGGCADSHNDHRIAMSAAIASLACRDKVKITNFEAINKSYPSFLENFSDHCFTINPK